MNRFFAIANRRYLKPLLALNLLLLAGLTYVIHSRPMRWQANAKLILPSSPGALGGDPLDPPRGEEWQVSPPLNPLSHIDGSLPQLWQQDRERDRFETVEDYRELFTASQQSGAFVLTLEVGADEPEMALERLERLIALLGDRFTQLRQGEPTEGATFTSEALVLAEAQLRSAQDQLTAFKVAAGGGKVEIQQRTLAEALSQLKTRYIAITTAQLSHQTEVDIVQARLKLTPDQPVPSSAFGEDETSRFLRQEIVRLDGEIARMRSIYQDDYPEVLRLQAERDQLQQQEAIQRANTLGANLPGSEVGPQSSDWMESLLLAQTTASKQLREAQELRQKIVELEQQIQVLPQQQAQLAELQRDYDNAQEVYNGLVAQETESSLNVAEADPSLQILAQPTVLAQPIGPKLSLMILGALFTAGFSLVALVMLLLEIRNPLPSPVNVLSSDSASGRRGLGTVPRFSISLQGNESLELAFQRLASGITGLRLKRRRILVSSATSGEGKTTALIGLGLALAALGFRVLLVDGDFYQAGLTQRLKRQLRVRSSRAEMLGAPVAVAPNLDLMPTTPGQSRRAMEFVARGDFETTLALAEGAGKYDYLLVDSAPMERTRETPMMGAATENVLWVTRAGFNQQDQIERAMGEFSRYRVNLLGLLVTATTQNSKPKPTQVYRQNSWSGTG